MLSPVASPSIREATAPGPATEATVLRHALVCHVPAEHDPKSDRRSSDTGSPFLGRQAGSPKVTQSHLPTSDEPSKSGTAGPEGAS